MRDRDNDDDDDDTRPVHTVSLDRRESMFPGASRAELEKLNLPKRFTDGSMVTVNYVHKAGEDIILFFQKLERQLRMCNPSIWVALLYERVSDNIKKSLDSERESLVAARLDIEDENGELTDAPAGDWAGFKEIKTFMLKNMLES